jgi:hypothetical protein
MAVLSLITIPPVTLEIGNNITLSVGQWVKFTSNNLSTSGQITRSLHNKTGEEGNFFSVKIFSGTSEIEMTFRLDKISGLENIESPASN